MKKILLSVLSLLLVTSSFSQIYVRVSAGYNLPAASEQLGVSEHSTYDPVDGYKNSAKGVYGSFGSGFVAHLAFGGAIKGGILGYDVDFGYLKGKAYDITEVDQSGSYVSENTASFNATSIQISPALTFTTGTGSFQPFARFGPTIAISKLMREETYYQSYYNSTTIWEYEYTGGLNIGLKGVVGCSYQLSDKMQVYVEADFVSLAYAPKKRTITRYEQNGVDGLGQIDPKLVEVEFEKEDSNTGEYGVPEVRPTFPMSSLGFQGGIKFIF
jgi:hypothetical protein